MFRASDVNVSQPDIMSVSMGMREYGRGGDEDEDEDEAVRKQPNSFPHLASRIRPLAQLNSHASAR